MESILLEECRDIPQYKNSHLNNAKPSTIESEGYLDAISKLGAGKISRHRIVNHINSLISIKLLTELEILNTADFENKNKHLNSLIRALTQSFSNFNLLRQREGIGMRYMIGYMDAVEAFIEDANSNGSSITVTYDENKLDVESYIRELIRGELKWNVSYFGEVIRSMKCDNPSECPICVNNYSVDSFMDEDFLEKELFNN